MMPAKMGPKVNQFITDSNFDEWLTKGPGIVMLWRPGCKSCKLMFDIVDGVPKGELYAAARHLPDLRFLLINSFNNPRIRDRYEVRGTPTLLLFRDGELKGRLVGHFPTEKILEWAGKPSNIENITCDFCLAARQYMPRFIVKWLEKFDAWRMAPLPN
jgi:thioredoxin 1